MDKIKVVDQTTGEVIMESDFDKDNPTRWKVNKKLRERRKARKRNSVEREKPNE